MASSPFRSIRPVRLWIAIPSSSSSAVRIRRYPPPPRFRGGIHRRIPTTTAETTTTETTTASATVESPTSQQRVRHFLNASIPFMGFGFMDNSIMIIAGNFIDCSVGVLLGLSTLSAAAIGQIVANGASVVFGGYVEALARRLGLPSAGLNSAQRSLPEIRRIGMFGNLCGVVVGAALGLIHLLWIDTARSTNLKLEAMSEEHEFAFTVEASNTQRHDATVFTIRGPDADGLLASLTAALATAGCAVRELHAKSTEDGTILDQIVVQTGGGGGTDGHHEPIPNEQLDQVARQLLAASRDPLMAHSLKTQNEELKQQNALLAQRVEKLERKLEDQQLTIVPTRT